MISNTHFSSTLTKALTFSSPQYLTHLWYQTFIISNMHSLSQTISLTTLQEHSDEPFLIPLLCCMFLVTSLAAIATTQKTLSSHHKQTLHVKTTVVLLSKISCWFCWCFCFAYIGLSNYLCSFLIMNQKRN